MTQIKGTNREFLKLLKSLESVKGLKGKVFAILVARNIEFLTNHLQPIEKESIPSIEFQQLSVEVQKKIEVEDEEGVKALEKENEELIEQRKQQLKTVERMLNLKSEVKVNLISEDVLPADITADQVYGLLKLLK